MTYEIIQLLRKSKDITGHVFGRLTAIAPVERRKKKIMWLCICECGTEAIVYGINLRTKNTTSCGCLPREKLIERNMTHGMSQHPLHCVWRKMNARCECGTEAIVYGINLRTKNTTSCGCLPREKLIERNMTHDMSGHRLYRVWNSMKNRCYRESTTAFPYYGGRGIRVCDRWKRSFSNFFFDMGECHDGMTLDRRDNDGDYTPENCRWSTISKQANNKRNNKFITHNGNKLSHAQWSRKLGGSTGLVNARLKLGWSEEQAVTQPVRHLSKRH